jgi:hypothetical protein
LATDTLYEPSDYWKSLVEAKAERERVGIEGDDLAGKLVRGEFDANTTGAENA